MRSLDIKNIRENPDLYRRTCEHKKIAVDIDRLLALDAEMRPLKIKLEDLQAARNRIAKLAPKADEAERKAIKESGIKIKKDLEQKKDRYRTLEQELNKLLSTVPLVPRADVPFGRSDADNVEIKQHGKPPQFSFSPRDHVELGVRNNLLDIERGVKIAGSRSYVLCGAWCRVGECGDPVCFP